MPSRVSSIIGCSAKTVAVFCAAALLPAFPAAAATVAIDALRVDYTTQSATSAAGSVAFDVRFSSPDADPGVYDSFSVQLLVEKLLGGTSAGFTLDASATANTGVIGPAYWIDNPPTGNEAAFTLGSEYRFEDFIVSANVTPLPGDVLAHFVIDFQATSDAQFGQYRIFAGDPGFNKFGRDLVFTYENTVTPLTFGIVPEPSTASFLVLAGAVFARRRKR